MIKSITYLRWIFCYIILSFKIVYWFILSYKMVYWVEKHLIKFNITDWIKKPHPYTWLAIFLDERWSTAQNLWAYCLPWILIWAIKYTEYAMYLALEFISSYLWLRKARTGSKMTSQPHTLNQQGFICWNTTPLDLLHFFIFWKIGRANFVVRGPSSLIKERGCWWNVLLGSGSVYVISWCLCIE